MSVFKHYLPGNWRIGRNFLNPLYEDSKASCNIYFDRHSGMYKMKDFGDDRYSGDCFFLVGQLKGLDCNRASDFIEILATIDRDLGLGLASCIPEKPAKPYQFREQKFTPAELEYWRQYGITPELLDKYKVCSLREYHSETAEGKPYAYTSSAAEPMFGSARTIASGWNNCPPKAIHYSSRAARKTCFRWRRMVSMPSVSTARR